jgi:hypothetical protein
MQMGTFYNLLELTESFQSHVLITVRDVVGILRSFFGHTQVEILKIILECFIHSWLAIWKIAGILFPLDSLRALYTEVLRDLPFLKPCIEFITHFGIAFSDSAEILVRIFPPNYAAIPICIVLMNICIRLIVSVSTAFILVALFARSKMRDRKRVTETIMYDSHTWTSISTFLRPVDVIVLGRVSKSLRMYTAHRRKQMPTEAYEKILSVMNNRYVLFDPSPEKQKAFVKQICDHRDIVITNHIIALYLTGDHVYKEDFFGTVIGEEESTECTTYTIARNGTITSVGSNNPKYTEIIRTASGVIFALKRNQDPALSRRLQNMKRQETPFHPVSETHLHAALVLLSNGTPRFMFNDLETYTRKDLCKHVPDTRIQRYAFRTLGFTSDDTSKWPIVCLLYLGYPSMFRCKKCIPCTKKVWNLHFVKYIRRTIVDDLALLLLAFNFMIVYTITTVSLKLYVDYT